MAKCVVDGVPLPHFGPFFLDDKYSVSEVMGKVQREANPGRNFCLPRWTDADFVQDINRYLEQRIDCRVRNLEELIYFNYQHSDKELPACEQDFVFCGNNLTNILRCSEPESTHTGLWANRHT